MKPINKIIMLMATTFAMLAVSMFQSCDQIEDILKNDYYFTMEYKFFEDNSVPVTVFQNIAKGKDTYLIDGANVFLAKDDGLAINRVIVNGDLSESGSNFNIFMNRKPREDSTYIRSVTILSRKGPFSKGQVVTPAYVEVITGAPDEPGKPRTSKVFTNNFPNTYCEITITSLNTTTKKMSGEFHFVVRDSLGQLRSEYLGATNGVFNFSY